MGSMRAAADELGLAPSSVSRQISRLEADLDIDLVKQGTHRISLTKAGEAVIEYYRSRLSQQEALLNRLDELRGHYMSSTIIAVGEGLLGTNSISDLQDFLRNNPGIHTEIVTAPSLEVQRMILEDTAHIGVVFSPPTNPTLRKVYSFPQPLRAIVHPKSKLAKRTQVTIEDLVQYPLVLPGPKFRVRTLIDAAGRDHGITIRPNITSNSLQVILDCVRSNIAITLLAELPIFSELQAGTFKSIPVDCLAMNTTDIQIVVRESRKLSPLSRDLIKHLARTINRLCRSVPI